MIFAVAAEIVEFDLNIVIASYIAILYCTVGPHTAALALEKMFLALESFLEGSPQC